MAVRYIFFAFISIGANMLTQFIFLHYYHLSNRLTVSLLLGTLTGLVIKYVLDKKYIFFDKTANMVDNSIVFLFYSSTGVITTSIFWGFELGFDYFFLFESSKYIGGTIGLTIGYIFKYFLDKKFVFRRSYEI